MTYSVLACEGAHDQAALTWLACICVGWSEASSVPPEIRDVFDVNFPRGRKGGVDDGRQVPTYLDKGGHLLIIKPAGGKPGVLAQGTAKFLSGTKAGGVGVIVDADDVGVGRRVEAFRTTYGPAFPHARDVVVGKVWGDNPRLGFWVAPDNVRDGEMDDALVMAATRSREALVKAGETFIGSAEKEAPGKWTEKRSKALLGSIYQVEAPGASLASGLARGKCWFDESITEIEPFGKLVKFIDAVGTGEPGSNVP